MSTVLDYADYAEMACQEENACYSSYPSSADVARSASRFIDPAVRPPDPFAVPYEYDQLAGLTWQAYCVARHEVFGEWYHHAKCPCCGTKLDWSKKSADSNKPIEALEVRLCANCGWWDCEECLYTEQEQGSSDYRARSVHRRAVLREFSIAGNEAPLESLRKHISQHPDDLRHISPSKLERLVGAVFADYMDCEAIHVGGPNDEGIDLVLLEGNRRYVVQVKRRKFQHVAEAVSGIREFIGAMVLHGTVKGLFVSTAQRFSPQAVATAHKAQEIGVVEYLQLVDAERLVDVCKLTSTASAQPWEATLSKPDELNTHVEPGYSKFMEMFYGHPEWKIARNTWAGWKTYSAAVEGWPSWSEIADRFKRTLLNRRDRTD